MRDNGNELVEARPGNGPWCPLMPQGINGFSGGCVKRAALFMRVDEKIGVNRDHAPRPL
jgi:hypothetical protein